MSASASKIQSTSFLGLNGLYFSVFMKSKLSSFIHMIVIHPAAVFTIEIAIITIVLSTLFFLVRYRNSQKKRFSKFDKNKASAEIQQAAVLQPHAIFVDLAPETADIVDLAVEIWRLNNRLNKVGSDMPDIQKRGLESSIQKFIKFLDRYDIKFIDHTGQKYSEGMNVDVLSFEKDQGVRVPIIKETIEPSITCQGMVVKKGKVIVINN